MGMGDRLGPKTLHQRQAQKEVAQEKAPAELSFKDFAHEYKSVMKAVALKEKKGRLDPDEEPYEPVSENEQALLHTDWKAFSRGRGFSEDDIQEYERWLVLSGQKDNLPGAINDPWRRIALRVEQRAMFLYVAHIEHALQSGRDILPSMRTDYERVKKALESQRQRGKGLMASPKGDTEIAIPQPHDSSTDSDIF